MRVSSLASVFDEPRAACTYRLLAAGGIVLAVLLAVMSLGGLLVPATYARETANWTAQAVAQDGFDLVVAAPALVVTALWARHGSRRGLLVFSGTLLFSVYTAAIYAFAVHLNALFLVYCAALGVASYTLFGAVARIWQARGELQLAMPIPHRAAGGYLVALGGVFALLWLAQLIPAAFTGRVPDELAATGLLTNPVHVMDLSFILPLHVLAGVALWRLRSSLALLAPIVLVFGVLMSASIAVLTAYMGGAAVAVAMATVSLVSLVFAALVLRGMR